MCVRELPELKAAVSGRDDAALVTVAVDSDERSVREVARALGLGAPVLPVLMDRPRGGEPLAQRYGVNRLPWTLVVDRRGRGVQVMLGGKDRDDFAGALAAID